MIPRAGLAFGLVALATVATADPPTRPIGTIATLKALRADLIDPKLGEQ